MPPLTKILCLALMGSLAITPVYARRHSAVEAQERQIAACIHRVSKGRLWLEKTLWGLRDQEGGWIGAAVPNGNGTHDLGPLQVNSWWVPRIARLLDRSESHVRQWLRDDPCFNAEAASWIFLTALATAPDYWTAVGIYHSPTPTRQRRYGALVAKHLRARFGSDIFSSRARPVVQNPMTLRGPQVGGIIGP